jgi:hypothetical protein
MQLIKERSPNMEKIVMTQLKILMTAAALLVPLASTPVFAQTAPVNGQTYDNSGWNGYNNTWFDGKTYRSDPMPLGEDIAADVASGVRR